MNAKLIIITVITILASGCSHVMRSDECARADWYTLGFEDGSKGATPQQIVTYREQCAAHHIAPDKNAYELGRKEGLSLYCTPENGYRAGRNGDTYGGACPPELEPAFKTRYDFGRRVYSLTTQISARMSEMRTADGELYAVRNEIHNTKIELTQNSLSEQTRYQLSTRLERYAARAGQLEERLRYLNSEVMRLQAQLATLQSTP